jgi:hypothetical protein
MHASASPDTNLQKIEADIAEAERLTTALWLKRSMGEDTTADDRRLLKMDAGSDAAAGSTLTISDREELQNYTEYDPLSLHMDQPAEATLK